MQTYPLAPFQYMAPYLWFPLQSHGRFTSMLAHGYLEPVIDKSGAGATAAKTVIQVFHETMSKHGGEPAMGLKRKPEVWCHVLEWC